MRLGNENALGIREDLFRRARHVVDLLAVFQDGRHDHIRAADDLPAARAPDA